MKTPEKYEVTDAPVKYRKHTLHPGALGHRRWLMTRKNKTLTTGKVDMESVMEICFAYVNDPLELQKIQGVKAKETIERFSDALTNEEFEVLQAHAEFQLLKYSETKTIPKKKPVQKRTGGRSLSRPKKR